VKVENGLVLLNLRRHCSLSSVIASYLEQMTELAFGYRHGGFYFLSI